MAKYTMNVVILLEADDEDQAFNIVDRVLDNAVMRDDILEFDVVEGPFEDSPVFDLESDCE